MLLWYQMSYRATGVMYGKKKKEADDVNLKLLIFILYNSCITLLIYDVYFNKFLGFFFTDLTIFCILLHHYFINAHAFIKTFQQLIFNN